MQTSLAAFAALAVLAGTATAADRLGLGRVATPGEVAAWDIDVRPDGMGLPAGRGSVAEGETAWTEKCAGCHGDFGEGAGRVVAVIGGVGTLTEDQPLRTVGSYWPYLSTVFDYVRRAMPYENARSLTDSEAFALTAYILHLNDLVDDTFVLSSDNFPVIGLPNADGFVPDGRLAEPHYQNLTSPCMADCKDNVRIVSRASDLDLTPRLPDIEHPADD